MELIYVKKKVYKILAIISCILFVITAIWVEINVFNLARWDIFINHVTKWIIPPIFFVLFDIFYILYKKEDK